ncbi:MAG: tetratricopeptide repeat protein, partial [Nitrospirae bacterium]|nr:tetratricopeptide repeat protein [Nitrospirota bacterium]
MKRQLVHLVIISLLGLLAYSDTFNAPFQWDEYRIFEKEPSIIKDLSYFSHPSKAKALEFYHALRGRFIGYLTFALNYKIHGLDVTGYHIVNIAIHLINALLVYFLVILTLKTPNLKESSLKEKSGYVALFSALIFVSHPVQTEAVTYIFQRLASLTAFFCLLSLVLYITWRLRQDTAKEAFPFKGILFYFFTLLSLVFAMKTKENAFMLPAIIALYEFFFFKGAVKKRILSLVPILLTMLIIPLSLTGTERPLGEAIGDIAKGHASIQRTDYLLTQFRVVATYIRLILFPVGQNIDYDYPVYNSLLD